MALSIAIMGTRGIPNHYGGFEHIAGYLSKGLVKRGYDVTVYNSSTHPYQKKEWHGVRIVHCFDPEYILGVAGQFVYDLNCILDARKKNFDILLMLGYTSSSVWGFLYPGKAIVITNMDGLEWQRAKYSQPVRRFLRYAEKLAVRSSDFHIADSPVIKKYIDDKYHIHSKYIGYGAALDQAADEEVVRAYGLEPYRYFMMMARMEPENNIEMVLDGFCSTASKARFVVIGDTRNGHGKRLVSKYKNDGRIVFPGSIFDERKVQSLTAFCRLYFHGHSVGGTNPSLLDTMAARVPIAAHDNPFNRSVLHDNALFFRHSKDINGIISNHQYANETCVNNNYSTILNEFTWDMIIDRYESYLLECCGRVQPSYPLKKEALVR